MYRYLLLFLLFSAICITARAQNPDTSAVVKSGNTQNFDQKKRDSVENGYSTPKATKKKEKVFHPDSTHSPHKAVMHSLMIPGWGQVYNHQYLFVPPIYGGLVTFVVLIRFNNKYYKEFLTISQYREHGVIPKAGDPYYTEYNQYSQQSNQALYGATDAYRRDRDLCYLGFFGFWGINAVQAYIAAKFQHSYTIDNNLSMRVGPSFDNQPAYAQNSLGSYIPGIKITLAIK